MSGAAVIECPPLSPSVIQDAMWQMNMRAAAAAASDQQAVAVDSRPYPERSGEPDCSYYLRTGICRYGSTCRFNHPANRKLAIANARIMGEYPERVGQPECQYYLKTGTCKFGATCKFHHPRDKAIIAGKVSLNILGYPLRPNEVECAYYLRTGQCKFGVTCKFHHPQPSNMMVQLRGGGYTSLQTPTSLGGGQQSYSGGGGGGWSRASFIPSPRWQGPSSYAAAPLIVPQGMVSVQGWSTYSNQLGSVSSSENLLQTVGNSPVYGTGRHGDSPDYYYSGGGGYTAAATERESENIFPERPGQPECQFYMKTGDCKFGAVCKFHHPKERSIPPPNCALSPIGLPLRPGEPLCIFYSRYGICKFGPSCKFNHPMGVFAYNLPMMSSSSSSLLPTAEEESAAARHLLAAAAAEEELVVVETARMSLSETRHHQMPSSSDQDNNIDTEG